MGERIFSKISSGTHQPKMPEIINFSFRNKVVLFTGFRSDVLKKHIEDSGGIVKQGKSKKVNLLIAAWGLSGTDKMEYALQNKIRILYYDKKSNKLLSENDPNPVSRFKFLVYNNNPRSVSDLRKELCSKSPQSISKSAVQKMSKKRVSLLLLFIKELEESTINIKYKKKQAGKISFEITDTGVFNILV